MLKAKGMKMQGLGKHYSTTQKKSVIGHSLVQCLYTIVSRSCPLEPLIYRQEKTARKEGIPFISKIDLMIQQIQNFTSPFGTVTHVLLDSWYSAKKSGKLRVIEDFKSPQVSDAIVHCAFRAKMIQKAGNGRNYLSMLLLFQKVRINCAARREILKRMFWCMLSIHT